MTRRLSPRRCGDIVMTVSGRLCIHELGRQLLFADQNRLRIGVQAHCICIKRMRDKSPVSRYIDSTKSAYGGNPYFILALFSTNIHPKGVSLRKAERRNCHGRCTRCFGGTDSDGIQEKGG